MRGSGGGHTGGPVHPAKPRGARRAGSAAGGDWFRQVAVGMRGAGGGLSVGPLIKPIKTKTPTSLTTSTRFPPPRKRKRERVPGISWYRGSLKRPTGDFGLPDGVTGWATATSPDGGRDQGTGPRSGLSGLPCRGHAKRTKPVKSLHVTLLGRGFNSRHLHQSRPPVGRPFVSWNQKLSQTTTSGSMHGTTSSGSHEKSKGYQSICLCS